MVVLAVIGLLAFGLLNKGTSLEVGDRVPDRELPKLDGKGEGDIADYRGRWVLVNLWASWCGPCRHEAPVLEDFYRANRSRNVTVLGINVQDNSEDAQGFVDEFHPTYPQLRSVGEERLDAYGAGGVPENYLVDPRGRLALIWRGPVDREAIEGSVEPIIDGASG
jgi:cytochrome c biogenesis protein CcmG/thiol:disulfide interchange protein DsbE